MPSPGDHLDSSVYGRALRTVLGAALTLVVALTAAWIFHHAPRPTVAPFVFVLVLALIARHFGTLPAFLGTLLAAVVFAWFLFPPLGSIQISDADARRSVEWMLIAGVVLADFIPAIWDARRKPR